MITNTQRLVRGGLFLLLLLAAGMAAAQWRTRSTRIENVRELESDSGLAVPEWKNEPEFKKDVFTFARIRYSARRNSRFYSRGAGMWEIDAPDSDLNFSFRLQQMTSMKVHPDGQVLEITDPRLFDYPWIYIVEPGLLEFSDEEVPVLRKYLLNGGFLMVDDFWGEAEWENFHDQMKRVFPNREPEELDLTHPIFHCVFDIKEKWQIPTVRDGTRSQYNGGITWERWDAKEAHYRAIFDDKGRIMVMICHNTDLGDGWEREGDNEYYFREFSEKRAYPLGINILFYTMTH
jgi:hypothetical protein